MHCNRVIKLRKYPDVDARCIYPDEHYEITKKDGVKVKYPCKSPFCPKHAIITRTIWAERIEFEFNLVPFNYSIYLPIGPIIQKEELAKLWQSCRRAWKRALGEFRYCCFLEIQNNKLHIHGIFHSNNELNIEKLKLIWKKFLKKHLNNKQKRIRTTVEQYPSGKATGQYITKTGEQDKEIQLPQQGFYPRLVRASEEYGMWGC